MNSSHPVESVAPVACAAPVIGVTGLPCSGKSHAARLLASGEIPGLPPGELLKADDMGHEILTRPDVVAELRAHFGEDAFTPAAPPDPAAVRRAIAERVFRNPAELAWLEGVIHPRVIAGIDAALDRNRNRSGSGADGQPRPVIMEAALLFAEGTAGLDARCDVILLIEADFETRLRRAASRGWDREELLRRERRQTPLFEAAKNGTKNGTKDGADARKIRIVRNDADGDEDLKNNLASAMR